MRGTVDYAKAKLAAEQDARNTVGVTGVANYIKVRPADELSDEQIEKGLREALALNSIVEGYQIEATVKNGVALEGMVDTHLERAEARDVAGRIRGVRLVRDAISVRSDESFVYNPYIQGWSPGGTSMPSTEQPPRRGTLHYRPDAQIERSIDSQFFWSPIVDGDRIEVTVENGVATLSGTVDCWRERMTARSNAYEGGAIAVRDRLRLTRAEN